MKIGLEIGDALTVSLGIVSLLWLVMWVAVWAVEQTLKAVKAYKLFCEFFWHRKEFKTWRLTRAGRITHD